MAIPVSEPESNFTPAPEGVHVAVCCDVVDLGMVDGQFGPKHKIEIRWQLDELTDRGDRHIVRQRYTASLSEKGKLRPQLEAWRGKKFTSDELRGFDLERLLGAPCQVQVVHNLSTKGKTFANVAAVMPLGKGQVAPRVDPGYVRQKDRAEDGGGREPGADDDAGDERPVF